MVKRHNKRQIMKITLIFIFTISTLKVAGQNHLIGVKGGVNSTNIISKYLGTSQPRTGITAGLTYDYLFKQYFSIGADFIYNQRGFTDDFILSDDFGNVTLEKNMIKFNYDYISLPIKTGFNIGTKLFGFTNIGVIPSLLVDAKSTVPIFDTDSKFIGYEKFDVTNRVSNFDFAGLFEMGGGYKLKGRYWLFTSFLYQRSFTSITTVTNSDYIANSKIQHNGMNLTIGLKCRLTKE